MNKYTTEELIDMINNTEDLDILKMLKGQLTKRNQVVRIPFGEYEELKFIEKEYEALCVHYDNLVDMLGLNETQPEVKQEEFKATGQIGFLKQNVEEDV